DTNLQPNEIVTAIELPALGFASNYSYLKIRDRLSYAFALVSIAAALELEGGTIKQARLALGGVAHKPWRASLAEQHLAGRTLDTATLRAAAAAELAQARPLPGNAFKVELAQRAIVRATLQAAGATGDFA
uniref:FAD binding domain-containing protein n=1 Tax=Paraburkholderia sp. TaxID=1926495 RepID=UPI0038621DA3